MSQEGHSPDPSRKGSRPASIWAWTVSDVLVIPKSFGVRARWLALIANSGLPVHAHDALHQVLSERGGCHRSGFLQLRAGEASCSCPVPFLVGRASAPTWGLLEVSWPLEPGPMLASGRRCSTDLTSCYTAVASSSPWSSLWILLPTSLDGSGANRMIIAIAATFWLALGGTGIPPSPC
jgi:hypothetical protein